MIRKRDILKIVTIKRILTAAFLSFCLLGCGREEAHVEVPVEEVVRGSVREKISGRGELRALVSRSVRMPVFHGHWRGLKVKQLAKEGSRVEPGDLLFVVDHEEMREDLKRIRTEERSTYAEFLNQQKDMELTWQRLNSDVEKRDERFREKCITLNLLLLQPATIKAMSAKNSYEMSQVSTQHAIDTYEPAEELAKLGYVSGAELERLRFDVKQAKVSERRARLQYEKVLSGADPIDIEAARLGVIRAQNSLRQAELDRALRMRKERMNVENQRWDWLREKRHIERIEKSIKACEVYADSEGVVVYNMVRAGRGKREKVKEGQTVWPRARIMRVDDTSKLVMHAEIEESEILNLEKGMDARVSVDSLPGKVFTGEVHEIDRIAHGRDEGKETSQRWSTRESSGIRVFDVEVLLDEISEKLKPGLNGATTIFADTFEDVLSVPIESVFTEGDRSFVFVRTAKGWKERTVTVSHRTRGRAVIAEGLDEGEQVATADPYGSAADGASSGRGNDRSEGHEAASGLKIIDETTIEKRSLPIVVTEIGELRPRDYTVIKAPISGEITYIIPEGSYVEKGDLVVKIDDSESREAVAGASIWLRSTKAQLEYARLQMEHTRETYELNAQLYKSELFLAKAQLDYLESLPLEQDRRLAEADLELRRIQKESSASDYERSKRLAGKGLLSEVNLREARLDKEEAEANYQKTKVDYELLMKGALKDEILVARERVRKAQIALEECLRNQELQVDLKRTAMVVDEAYVDRVQAEIDRHQRRVDKAAADAPKSGTIIYRSRWEKPEEGQTVYRGDSLIELTDMTRMVVSTKVNEVDLRRVEVGQDARIRLEAMPDRVFKGAVMNIAGLATDRSESGSRGAHMTRSSGVMVFSVTVEITEKDPALRPSLTASVDIIIDELTDKLTVPLAYIQRYNGEPAVYVKQDGSLRLKHVTTGERGSSNVVIEEGLQPGDTVCLVRRDETR